jgi:hypothetical protein
VIVKDMINSFYTSLKGGTLFSVAHLFVYLAHHISRLQMRVIYALTGNVRMLYLEIVTTTRCTLKMQTLHRRHSGNKKGRAVFHVF